MKQGIDHCGEEEMAPLSPTDRRNQRRRRNWWMNYSIPFCGFIEYWRVDLHLPTHITISSHYNRILLKQHKYTLPFSFILIITTSYILFIMLFCETKCDCFNRRKRGLIIIGSKGFYVQFMYNFIYFIGFIFY